MQKKMISKNSQILYKNLMFLVKFEIYIYRVGHEFLTDFKLI